MLERAEKRILQERERFRAMQSTSQVDNLIFNCSGHCSTCSADGRGDCGRSGKVCGSGKFLTKGILELAGYNQHNEDKERRTPQLPTISKRRRTKKSNVVSERYLSLAEAEGIGARPSMAESLLRAYEPLFGDFVAMTSETTLNEATFPLIGYVPLFGGAHFQSSRICVMVPKTGNQV